MSLSAYLCERGSVDSIVAESMRFIVDRVQGQILALLLNSFVYLVSLSINFFTRKNKDNRVVVVN